MHNQEHGQGEELVVVYRAPDEFTANIIKGFLEDDGIPVVLESRMVPWMDGVMKTGEGYWGDVVVPARCADRSRELIEQYQPEPFENSIEEDSSTEE